MCVGQDLWLVDVPVVVKFLNLAPVMAIGLCGCGALEVGKASRATGVDLEVEGGWASAKAGNSGDAGTGWVKSFGDRAMEELVDEAIRRNQNLRAVAARLKSAKAGTIIGRAGRLPSFGLGSGATYSGSATEDFFGDLGGFVDSESSRLSLDASWEIDLWGRLRDNHRATEADYEAQLADYRGARLSLAANTAKAWCNLIAARQQVALAEKTRDIFLSSLGIIERNYEAGDQTQSSLDVQFARNQVTSAERGYLSTKLARDEARRSLEVLIGRYPKAILSGRDELPEMRKKVPAGLPSELLMRRPDLVASAARVRASADRADSARKAMLPSITLTGGASSGLANYDLLDLVQDPSTIARSVAASLAQPVFRGGRLVAQGEQALAQNEAAVMEFSSTALRAFREVESALATEYSLMGQIDFLREEVEQANLAEAQSERDLTQGLVGYLSVLEAQRRAFNSRNTIISLRTQLLLNRIDLYLALGGDFR